VGGVLVWLQNSVKDGYARFEECGLGFVEECKVGSLALVAEALTIGILGRPVGLIQLVEIVEEVQSKAQ